MAICEVPVINPTDYELSSERVNRLVIQFLWQVGYVVIIDAHVRLAFAVDLFSLANTMSSIMPWTCAC